MSDHVKKFLKTRQVQPLRPSVNLEEIALGHKLVVVEDTVKIPFSITSELAVAVQKHASKYKVAERRARAIFDWMQSNFVYGDSKRKQGYRNASEVMKHRQGVCGELAYVYTTCARLCGIDSSYVSVRKDNAGKKVVHACSSVKLDKLILVDPAYYTYDIKHKEFKLLSDNEALENFRAWRML